MSEDTFVMNMDEVEDKTFGDIIPNGWYKAVVTNYSEERHNGSEVIVKNAGGKLPQGTKGTEWMFTLVETPDAKFDGWKLWTTYWHHGNTASFWKGLYKAAGVEAVGKVDLLELRDEALGEELWIRVGSKTSPGYDPQNVVKGLKHLSERKDPNASSSSSDEDDFEDDLDD